MYGYALHAYLLLYVHGKQIWSYRDGQFTQGRPRSSKRSTNTKCTYRKNSKNWDTLNYYRDCPTNGIVGFYSAILRSKDADRITNRVDYDQTAP